MSESKLRIQPGFLRHSQVIVLASPCLTEKVCRGGPSDERRKSLRRNCPFSREVLARWPPNPGARPQTLPPFIHPPSPNRRRGDIAQPEPISKRQKTSLESIEYIMSRPYDQLRKDSDRHIWLRAALTSRGEIDFDEQTSIDVLKNMYDEIEADPDAGIKDTTQADLGVYTSSTTPMNRGHATPSFMPSFAQRPCDSGGEPALLAISSGANSQDLRLADSQPAPSTPHPSTSQQRVVTTGLPQRIRITPARFHELRRQALLQAQHATKLAKTPGPTAEPHTSSSSDTQPDKGKGKTSAVGRQPPMPAPNAHNSSNIPVVRNATSQKSMADGVHAVGGASNPADLSRTRSEHPDVIPVCSRTVDTTPNQAPLRPSSSTASPAPRSTHTNASQPDHHDSPNQSDEEPDDIEGQPNNAVANEDGATTETRRQQAQLRKFGPIARPAVKATSRRIELRMLVHCAFPELTPSNDQGLNGDPALWSLFDEWALECWAEVNAARRPGQPRLPLKREYKDWLRLQLPHPRTALKKYLTSAVTHTYGFQPGVKHTANTRLSADLWCNDRFIFEDPDNIKTIFRHDIIGFAIYAMFFKGQGVGTRHRELFDPMPTTLIALVCCILRHVIGEYKLGEYVQQHLSNTVDVGWYRGYMKTMERMARQTPTRLHNIWNNLKVLCLGDGLVDDASSDDIDLGSDSEEEME
ncbi:hypothetical protein FRC06_002014, partial [Ceratobasidium sp. 370]